MKNIAMLVVVAWVTLVASGCTGRLIGEGAEAAMGPKGKYWQEKALAESKQDKVLAEYGTIRLGQVTNGFGRHVPDNFISDFRRHFEKELAGARIPRSGSKTLTVNVVVLHYEKADTTDNVFGPLEEVVARVEMVDQGGQVLSVGNAVGRTTKTVGLGVGNKAEGLAKGIVKWISDYSPKPPKE